VLSDWLSSTCRSKFVVLYCVYLSKHCKQLLNSRLIGCIYIRPVYLIHDMPATGCCVPECNGLGGHRFPRDKNLKKQWMIAIRRDKWQPTATSLVCRRHFTDSDYRSETTAGMGRLCYVSGHLGSFCTSHELTRVIVTVRAKLRVSI